VSIQLLNPTVLGGMGFDVSSMRLRSNENPVQGRQENWVQFEAPSATDEDRAACEAFKDHAAFFIDGHGGWFMVKACMIAGNTISFRVEAAEAEQLQDILDQVEEQRPTEEVAANERAMLIDGLQSMATMFTRAADMVIENGELKVRLAELENKTNGSDDDHSDEPPNDIVSPLHNQEYPH